MAKLKFSNIDYQIYSLFFFWIKSMLFSLVTSTNALSRLSLAPSQVLEQDIKAVLLFAARET